MNVGLVLLPTGAPVELRKTRDWSRVRGLDPQADAEQAAREIGIS